MKHDDDKHTTAQPAEKPDAPFDQNQVESFDDPNDADSERTLDVWEVFNACR